MKAETDITTSIAVSLIRQALILKKMSVKTLLFLSVMPL